MVFKLMAAKTSKQTDSSTAKGKTAEKTLGQTNVFWRIQ
jgi:hypothetical protein